MDLLTMSNCAANLELKLTTGAVDQGGEGKVFKVFLLYYFSKTEISTINTYPPSPPWSTQTLPTGHNSKGSVPHTHTFEPPTSPVSA